MTLKEYLDIYKSTKKIYIREHSDDNISAGIGLFSDAKHLPQKYLDSYVTNWTYKLDAANIGGTEMAIYPIATLKIVRG